MNSNIGGPVNIPFGSSSSSSSSSSDDDFIFNHLFETHKVLANMMQTILEHKRNLLLNRPRRRRRQRRGLIPIHKYMDSVGAKKEEELVHNEKSSSHDKKAPGISHHSKKSSSHDKETHGLSDDINEDTPIDEVKGPGVFERVKEEVEAVVEAVVEVIHPKK